MNRDSEILNPESEIIRVLLIEDNPGDARLVREMLVETGTNRFNLKHVERISQGLTLLSQESFQVILLDLSLPDGYGLETVDRVCNVAPHVPILVLTGLDDETLAIRSLREGAQDYLVKGQMDSNLFMRTIRYATERKRAEEALRRSEEKAKRLAQENEIVAEIGRIISSTLNIEEVYERFVEEVRKLIRFDRVVINTIDPEHRTLTVAYVSGKKVAERRRGDVIPLPGTATEKVMRERSAFVMQLEDENEVGSKVPGLLPAFRAGFRSMMVVPLISKDQLIGVLHFQLIKPNVYTGRDQNLAERVGNQIAGAIANAQLFTELKRTKERILTQQAVLEGINKVLQETLACRTDEEVACKCLTVAQELTGSRFGFIGEVNTAGSFDAIAVSDSGWKACRMPKANREAMMKGMEIRGIWGRVLKEEKSLTVNDPASCPYRAGTPEGHPLLASFLGVPLKHRDKTIGMIALANKESGYQLADQHAVEALSVAFLESLNRKRAEKEKRVLQEQFRQSQKMEAIGQLAGGIAHDFNNLLTVIKGYSELSLNQIKDDLPLEENLREIKKASDRAVDLTRQLLAFSRHQVFKLKVLDLNSILRNLEKMLRRMISEDIELVFLLAGDLGKIKADPGQIEQVILNLAVNARDAMPNGGKLTIETANEILDEAYARSHIAVRPGQYVRLSVSDTGVGMPEEVKERVFEPFFTTKGKGKGTGLGLSTVYGIVKQSEGNIWLYSEPGQGTAFKIYLPRVDEPVDELCEKEEVKEASQGGETVLVVEDDEAVRKLAVQALKRKGYSVLVTNQADEALSLCKQRKEPVHLLLTDVVMPQMSGYELVEGLKQVRNDFKVLYMSGYTDDAIVHHGVLEKGVNFIQKPFTIDGLARKVREVLDKRNNQGDVGSKTT